MRVFQSVALNVTDTNSRAIRFYENQNFVSTGGVVAVEGFDPDKRNSADQEFVTKVTEQNVRQTVIDIRTGSPVLADLERSGDLKIVGAIYDLQSGKVTLLE